MVSSVDYLDIVIFLFSFYFPDSTYIFQSKDI